MPLQYWQRLSTRLPTAHATWNRFMRALTHRSMFGALSLAFVACAKGVCPPGTLKEGEACHVVHAAAQGGGQAVSVVDPTSTSNPKGDAGHGAIGSPGASAGQADISGGTGAEPSTPGSAALGNAGASPAAAGVGGASVVAGANGHSVVAGVSGGKTSSGGTSATSATGGTGGLPGTMPKAGAGSGAPSAGDSAGAAADSGVAGVGSPVAGNGGSGATSGDWFCLDTEASCTCVAGQGLSEDLCSDPKPPCCFTLRAAGSDSCQCWPNDSDECRGFKEQDPNATRVTTCPPN